MQSSTSSDYLFKNDYNNLFDYDTNNDSLLHNNKTLISKSRIEFYNIFWEILHLITFIYPVSPTHFHKIQIEFLFDYMKNGGIPCSTCTIHFREFLKQYDLHDICNNRYNFKKFMIDLHNYVNKRLSKKIYSYLEVEQLYSNISERCEYLLLHKNINIYKLLENDEIYTFIDKIK